ncbi:hypothetical protein P171DRAFT_174728 [Karstenula rhodostoma CBS 690.94]|uniref:Uncharacterized protein n=1 Tax=Karstenula rhodostoma CBS 690.94 TaxID=1392251 RepID=A0A9P4P5M6_9PLEO|nr:hypothetical protein P171DRAFT_174728 [Karstenula rhodostoma CBS 690.94]
MRDHGSMGLARYTSVADAGRARRRAAIKDHSPLDARIGIACRWWLSGTVCFGLLLQGQRRGARRTQAMLQKTPKPQPDSHATAIHIRRRVHQRRHTCAIRDRFCSLVFLQASMTVSRRSSQVCVQGCFYLLARLLGHACVPLHRRQAWTLLCMLVASSQQPAASSQQPACLFAPAPIFIVVVVHHSMDFFPVLSQPPQRPMARPSCHQATAAVARLHGKRSASSRPSSTLNPSDSTSVWPEPRS